MKLFNPDNHEQLAPQPWFEGDAISAIYQIVESTCCAYSPDKFWPIHSEETLQGISIPRTSLYSGAAGVFWALSQLPKYTNEGVSVLFSEKSVWDKLYDLNKDFLQELSVAINTQFVCPGYLVGTVGLMLLNYKLYPSTSQRLSLVSEIMRNITLPENDVMFGQPGTTLAALHLYYMESRDKHDVDSSVLQKNLVTLLESLRFYDAPQCHLWQQSLFNGTSVEYGLIHGFAGNIFALIRAIDFLSAEDNERLLQHAIDFLSKTAIYSEDGSACNWMPGLETHSRANRRTPLVQVCHGAPGIIIGLSPLLDVCSFKQKKEVLDMFLKAGETIWRAGPLKKLFGLCHGNAGNGYAFLKLFQITRDPCWLSRARSFAMHAIIQYKHASIKYHQCRYALMTGDLGLAIFLQDCIDAEREPEKIAFPLFDRF